MEKLSEERFLKTLKPDQMIEMVAFCNDDMNEIIVPSLKATDKIIPFEHFMTLSDDRHICVDADYHVEAGSEVLTRNVREVRVYQSKFEMEFYMSLSNYNTDMEFLLESERIIFN